MTEEQLAIARSIREDYKKFSDIAANMGWAKIDSKCVEVYADAKLNLQYAFISICFEEGYVRENFAAAFAQMMLAMLCLCEEWDIDEMWGKKHTSPEERKECFVNGEKYIYGQYLKFKEVHLSKMNMEELTERLIKDAIWDRDTRTSRDCELPDDAKAMLEYFSDVPVYSVGEESWVRTAAWNWMALKGDAFLYVRYFEGWD